MNENPAQKDLFHQSRMEEVKALVDLGYFEIVFNGITGDNRLYQLRSVDLIKAD